MRMEEAASEEAVAQIAGIARTTWNESYRGMIPQEQIDYMLDNIQSPAAIRKDIDDGHRYFVIYSDGTEAGYLAILPEEDGVFLSKIYVFERFKGTGVASDAIGFVKDLASGKRVRLTVNRNNHRALAFYKKMGFVIASQQVKDIGGGFVMDDHVMTTGER